MSIQRLDDKQRRSWWGGSIWATSSRSTLFANSAISVSGTYKEFSRTNSNSVLPDSISIESCFHCTSTISVLLKAIFAGGRVYVITWAKGPKQKDNYLLNILSIGVGRGGGGGRGGGARPPPNNFGGDQHTLWPPNNPPAFSFNFYVKQKKITNVPNWRVK